MITKRIPKHQSHGTTKQHSLRTGGAATRMNRVPTRTATNRSYTACHVSRCQVHLESKTKVMSAGNTVMSEIIR